MRSLLLAAALTLALAGASLAHKRDTVVTDTSPATAGGVSREGQPAAGTGQVEVRPYRMPPFGEALAHHPHNKIVHFPIVLTLVAAGTLLVSRRRPEWEPLAFWLVWAAALSVLAAYFSGVAQAKEFEGEPKEWLVELHEKQGITIGVLEALWVLSLLRDSTRRFSWIIGLVLALLVLSAGYLGGLVAHSD